MWSEQSCHIILKFYMGLVRTIKLYYSNQSEWIFFYWRV